MKYEAPFQCYLI